MKHSISIIGQLAILVLGMGSSILAEPLKELVILHTNDMHAHLLGVMPDDSMCSSVTVDQDNCFGGFDRIATAVDAVRQKTANTLVVDAGDQFQGTMFHQFYQGLASATLMNAVGYDAMVAGNHEFDDGSKVLARFIGELKFPFISANIDASQDPNLKGKIKPFVIVRKNDLRIGIVGYTTQDTSILSNPGTKIKFLPIIPSLKKAVNELKKAKVDVIIALSHAGLSRDKEIAQNVDGIAAIVAGHSNSLLANNVKNSDGPSPLVVQSPNKKPVLLVSAYAYGKFLGYLKLSFDKSGVPTQWQGEPILLDKSIERRKDLRVEIERLHKPILEQEKQLIGTVAVDLDARNCRFEECVFGNFVTDSLVSLGAPLGASIALMNSGGIRASIPKGQINNAQLKGGLPFEKRIVLVKISGEQIRRVLEHGLSFVDNRMNDNTGRFLQVAGLKYSFDSAKKSGQRLVQVQIYDDKSKCFVPLEENKDYGVVINSYLAQGGDGYSLFAQTSERWSLNVELKDLLATFLSSPESQLPKLDGRITNLAHSTQLRLHQGGSIVK